VPAETAIVASALPRLDSDHRMLLECVDFSPTPLEIILKRCGLKGSELNTMLLSLEIKGYINKVTAGYLRLGVANNENERLL